MAAPRRRQRARRTYPGPAGTLADGVTTFGLLLAAWRSQTGYVPDEGGRPVAVAVAAPAVPAALAPVEQTHPVPAARQTDLVPAPVTRVLHGTVLARPMDPAVPTWMPYEPTALTLLGEENLLLRQVAFGHLALGVTVDDLIVETLRLR